MSEIQKADPELRRKTTLIFGVVALICMLSILAFKNQEQTLRNWVIENKDYLVSHPHLVALAFFIFMSPLLGGSIYFWKLALRIVKAKRFPPPETKIIRDTPIVSGKKAVVKGRALQTISFFLALSTFLVPAMVYFIFLSLAGK